ncbi:MAG TPA: 6-hydroxymethylpterin diphosphokinase MptE-like protein [Spirochaetia bacterium]|nr:6-hydroxymethylpterin diphosphokinase MptE-like protein [Spirochaetia bacterium]
MSFEIRHGSRGPLAFWDGRQLCSAYDPGREARTWAESLSAGPGSLVFVAGDPWGLASQALGTRGIRAIALLPGAAALPWVPEGVEAWAPGALALEDFLQEVFETTGPEAVVWELWPAFERQAGEVALDWSRRFRDLFRTVQGSWLTYRRFGPRFWTNAIRNYLGWDHPIQQTPGDRPLVIAASGPSLDDGLDVLARHRDRFDLWALPSSFETLVRRGLVPDAGVATDGGFYAREHLHRLAGTGVPILAALGSAPDRVLSASPCWFFSQSLPIERELLARHGAVPEVPSQGTVAVSALRLALEATTGPVFIAGLDLSFRDFRGHTSPHTVDRRLEARHGRFAPLEGLWAERLFDQAPLVHEGVRTSGALLTYALWFRSRARFRRTVYRIAPSALRWPTMVELGWDEAVALWQRARGTRVGKWEERKPQAREDRRRTVEEVLDRLVSQVGLASEHDPRLIEWARTAVPEALADEFRARRSGRGDAPIRPALVQFFTGLREGLR